MKQQIQTPDSKEGLHTLEVVGYNSIYERKPNGSLGKLIAIADGLDARQSKVNAELIVKAVNERKALLDSHRELIEKLTMAKSAYFHLKMELNPKWDYAKDVYYQEFLTAINNAKNI